MRLFALMCFILSTGATLLLKTRLPPKPRGELLYFEAFRNVSYTSLCVVSFVSRREKIWTLSLM